MLVKYQSEARRRFLGCVFLTIITAIWFLGMQSATAATLSKIHIPRYPVTVDELIQSNGLPMTNHTVASWPAIISRAAVVMDMDTGTVVYAKNPLQPHYPASITKILTAYIALQLGNLNDELVTNKLATEQAGNRLYLVQGEVEPLRQLLYGLLLDSGNDAAVVIAEHYGQSIAGFAKLMNQTAKSLGATHSYFINPNGLPNRNHVTTAYDMALIARAAMQNPVFRTMVATKTYDWKGQEWSAKLVNLNHMLFNYPGAIGIKTGYTLAANETLVVAAKRGNTTFLAVLMDAPLDREIRADATRLLNFAFANYNTETIIQQGQIVGRVRDGANSSIALYAGQSVVATEPVNTCFSLVQKLQLHLGRPMSAGDVAGRLTLSTDATVRAEVPVLLSTDYKLPASMIQQQRVAGGAIGIALWAVAIISPLLYRWRQRVKRRKTDTQATAAPERG